MGKFGRKLLKRSGLQLVPQDAEQVNFQTALTTEGVGICCRHRGEWVVIVLPSDAARLVAKDLARFADEHDARGGALPAPEPPAS